jgi:hypothetical protein
MKMRLWVGAIALAGALAAGCTGKESPPKGGAANGGGDKTSKSPPLLPPVRHGDWTYWGRDQGLSDDIQDVSADEAGNVYVAGGEALFAKSAADASFLRFDAANAGFTQNCNDFSEYYDETPPKPFYMCRILSVAGASPGKAFIGFDSFNIESQKGATWTFSAGGSDAISFDPAKGTASRLRHYWLASPPHTICTKPVYGRTSTCDPTDYWWNAGRRVFVQVLRIVVNHDKSSPMYGDAWLGGKHATFAAILKDAAARNYRDRTAGMPPEWADAKDTWEHLHPAETAPDGTFVNGRGWALSIDPRTGIPWGSNEFRTTYVGGYGADLTNDEWWQGPYLDLWPDPPQTYFIGTDDNVHSMSHCNDGTLWLGSLTHGLARIATDGTVSTFDLPDPMLWNGVEAVACDPSDSSLWIGLRQGGLMRLRNGAFQRIDTSGLPAFTNNPVQSIQIDRWTTPRKVYFAFRPVTDDAGKILAGGGVGEYSGP